MKSTHTECTYTYIMTDVFININHHCEHFLVLASVYPGASLCDMIKVGQFFSLQLPVIPDRSVCSVFWKY